LYGLQILLENSGKFFNFFLKNRDTLNTKHFQNSIVYYLLFYFFSIFDIFFFYFTCLWFSKKLENFCVVLLYGSEILSKNWDIWNPKFQQNSIVYYFFFNFLAFLAFCFLFHVPQLVQKLSNFLWCFIGSVRDFTNDFWKILKVLLKKILICKIFFFQNFAVYYLFFYFFYYFWHFIFNFVYL